jgi:hypothetical protein
MQNRRTTKFVRRILAAFAIGGLLVAASARAQDKAPAARLQWQQPGCNVRSWAAALAARLLAQPQNGTSTRPFFSS